MPRVLIVDDFADAAEATEMLLTLRGCTCQVAVSGADALAIVDGFAPDIAMLDIGLPDISGFDLARQLRRRRAGHPLYLAAVTGWGDTETRIKAIAAGFDQHVTKPTNRHKIDEILRAATEALAKG